MMKFDLDYEMALGILDFLDFAKDQNGWNYELYEHFYEAVKIAEKHNDNLEYLKKELDKIAERDGIVVE